LKFEEGEVRYTKKLVLATGRGGFGGNSIPAIIETLPKEICAHTSENIDFDSLKGKRVLIYGFGASALDAAAECLEKEAVSVTILTRRKKLPCVNKFARTVYPGFSNGYPLLSDDDKIAIMSNVERSGSPPPFESLDRVKKFSNFEVLTGFEIQSVKVENEIIYLGNDKTTLEADYIIAATGFNIDGSKEPILKGIFDHLMLWRDKHSTISHALGAYPYLGCHYHFLEKRSGEAPFLKNIYCFNYAAKLSHGLTSSDIPDISIGAERLSKGIVSDFFIQNSKFYVDKVVRDDIKEYDPADYSFIKLL
jgi:cation diffusion facilitator CzcD-associated flavoprotein CzcO